MPYVITEACIGTKDKACVDVCPVDCIYPETEPAQSDIRLWRVAGGIDDPYLTGRISATI